MVSGYAYRFILHGAFAIITLPGLLAAQDQDHQKRHCSFWVISTGVRICVTGHGSFSPDLVSPEFEDHIDALKALGSIYDTAERAEETEAPIFFALKLKKLEGSLKRICNKGCRREAETEEKGLLSSSDRDLVAIVRTAAQECLHAEDAEGHGGSFDAGTYMHNVRIISAALAIFKERSKAGCFTPPILALR